MPKSFAERREKWDKFAKAGMKADGVVAEVQDQITSLDNINKIMGLFAELNGSLHRLEERRARIGVINEELKKPGVDQAKLNEELGQLTTAVNKTLDRIKVINTELKNIKKEIIVDRKSVLPKEVEKVIDRLDRKFGQGTPNKSKKIFGELRDAIPVLNKDRQGMEDSITSLDKQFNGSNLKPLARVEINALAKKLEDPKISPADYAKNSSMLEQQLAVYRDYCADKHISRYTAIGKFIAELNYQTRNKFADGKPKIPNLYGFEIDLDAIAKNRPAKAAVENVQKVEPVSAPVPPQPANPVVKDPRPPVSYGALPRRDTEAKPTAAPEAQPRASRDYATIKLPANSTRTSQLGETPYGHMPSPPEGAPKTPTSNNIYQPIPGYNPSRSSTGSMPTANTASESSYGKLDKIAFNEIAVFTQNESLKKLVTDMCKSESATKAVKAVADRCSETDSQPTSAEVAKMLAESLSSQIKNSDDSKIKNSLAALKFRAETIAEKTKVLEAPNTSDHYKIIPKK